MTPLLPAVAGALVVAGLIGLTLGLRRTPPPPPTPRRVRPGLTRIAAVTPRTRALLLAGLTAGVVVAVLTGWWVAALVLPAAAALTAALAVRPRPDCQCCCQRRGRGQDEGGDPPPGQHGHDHPGGEPGQQQRPGAWGDGGDPGQAGADTPRCRRRGWGASQPEGQADQAGDDQGPGDGWQQRGHDVGPRVAAKKPSRSNPYPVRSR